MVTQPVVLTEAQVEIAVPQIRSLVLDDPVAKKAFGGQHYVFSEELTRELNQFGNFVRNGLPKRQRVRLGCCVFDDRGNVTGYQAITVMQDAKPNLEETEYVGIKSLLNYVQLKKLVVRKDYRGEGVAGNLLQVSLELSQELDKKWRGDVLATNSAVIKFLGKHNIEKLFEWHNKAGNLMWRMGIV